MSRLIDADELKTIRSINRANFNSIETIQAWIDSAPTVDAEPVRHAHWKPASRAKNDKSRIYQCAECGNFLDFDGVNAGRGDGNYCPNCGARMDEVTE